jgi:excisionase family DNA binding protein
MPSARKPARSPAPPEPLASPEEVSAYLGVPVATLKAWRHERTGPSYTHAGRHVRYDWADVREWKAANYVDLAKPADGKQSAA